MTLNQDSFDQILKDWDGKHTQPLLDFYPTLIESLDWIEFLLKQFHLSPTHQQAATWLLKHGLENKHSPSSSQTEAFFALLSSLESWQSQLHALQSLPFLTIKSTEVRVVESFLRSTLSSANTFVRAWSYSGFYQLATHYPEFREEVRHFFALAEQDEPASVKARLRQCLKQAHNW